jgi:mannose-1-phosphate guanylyltransferase
MKAFLLAAGEGRRLRPITDSVPKCLVPIRGTPLLALWLELLERHGVSQVLLNLHYQHERVLEYLDTCRTSVSVTTTYEPQLLGSAGTVRANREYVAGERAFLIIYADNLTNADLASMVRFHETRSAPLTMAVAPTDVPWEKGTVVLGRDGEVLEFVEKAQRPPSHLANAGIYVADSSLFPYLTSSAPADGPFDFGHHVLPRMVPHVNAYPINDFVMDIGTPASYTAAQHAWPGLA